MEQPIALESNFWGRTTFPHYLKFKELTATEFEAEILYDPANPIKKDTLVSKSALNKNSSIFRVEKTEGLRDGKGDWTPYGISPKWVKITASHVGYWDDENQVVSKEKVGQPEVKQKTT